MLVGLMQALHLLFDICQLLAQYLVIVPAKCGSNIEQKHTQNGDCLINTKTRMIHGGLLV